MKRQKLVTLFVLVLSVLLVTAGCSKNAVSKPDAAATTESTATADTQATADSQTQVTPSADANGAFQVTDMVGKTIEFDKTPEKIVALLASDVEILYSLGAQDSIVARGEYCNYPSEAAEKTVITTGEDLNLEQVISLAPDVVVMGTMAQTEDQTKQLENAGIKVVTTNSENIADVYEAITLLGQISGKRTEAQTLVESMKSEFQAIKDKVDDSKKDQSIYFEVSPLAYGLWTAGQNTFMQELADMVGIKNTFADVTGWSEVSEEQVLERNPDFIITTSMYYEGDMNPSEEVMYRKNWTELNAIKNKNVISNETDMFTRPGPRLVDAAKALYQFVYGE